MIESRQVYQRDMDLLQTLITKYKMSITLESFLKDFPKVTIYADNTEKVRRVRLIGFKQTWDEVSYETYDEVTQTSFMTTSKVPDSEKNERVQLFVLNRRTLERMNFEELKNVFFDLNRFVIAMKQIRLLQEIEEEENNFQSADEIANLMAEFHSGENNKTKFTY